MQTSMDSIAGLDDAGRISTLLVTHLHLNIRCAKRKASGRPCRRIRLWRRPLRTKAAGQSRQALATRRRRIPDPLGGRSNIKNQERLIKTRSGRVIRIGSDHLSVCVVRRLSHLAPRFSQAAGDAAVRTVIHRVDPPCRGLPKLLAVSIWQRPAWTAWRCAILRLITIGARLRRSPIRVTRGTRS